ncbi:LysR family transcriptional regulator [soil metagenome]
MDAHLRDLRYFVAVAEELHFGRAAERLFISQPALSRQIAKLERDLGTSLLERDRRSVALTAAGSELLKGGRSLLANWDETQRAVSDRAAAAGAVLRVGIQTSIGRGIVADLQAALSRRNPLGRLDLIAVDWADPTVGISDGRVDVAIGWLPLPRQDEFAVNVVAAETRHLAMAADHRLAEKLSLSFAEIEGEAFIALPEGAGPARGFWLAESERTKPATIAAVARNAEEALEAVASGLGVVLLAAGNAELYAREGIVTRPVTDLRPAELALITDGADVRPLVRDLVEAVS